MAIHRISKTKTQSGFKSEKKNGNKRNCAEYAGDWLETRIFHSSYTNYVDYIWVVNRTVEELNAQKRYHVTIGWCV